MTKTLYKDKISVSIVSHRNGRDIQRLLDDLASENWAEGHEFEIIVVVNVPEQENWLDRQYPFTLKVIRNCSSRGFGANNNSAFSIAEGSYFAVVNPDIRLQGFRVGALLQAIQAPDCGICGPRVVNARGISEDNARRFPSIARLARRRIFGRSDQDYSDAGGSVSVDWLAGMFMIFRADVFRSLGGFDERYFMYLEDTEICRYAKARGYSVEWVPSAYVYHEAARASRTSLKHFWWHFQSLIRFLMFPKRG
jgi:N-acetylglucosaminyl-diphospho-decaprenol L-rhamnosyltransferase